ncbi:hypothetical protein GUITHDRAFT_151532 [Guillardia theta CCMP2712]|uniref:PDZ domain-containing protein n=3 Tax=Guillardia theta TaxID=55529 RepID=L1JLH8_GUITC|nr:hypothetical protein GUITHDRAFT_151532 [Guillardia theta CCMP2712]EKX49381.1 hypothetical protein GUITHDRAFT_151532 [Guillardia theta CCMP2712]|eukprot:XP_005836361.1 hypothetical protein GUITHDRAFT_151532 [Guillardia theta CCMP2712]
MRGVEDSITQRIWRQQQGRPQEEEGENRENLVATVKVQATDSQQRAPSDEDPARSRGKPADRQGTFGLLLEGGRIIKIIAGSPSERIGLQVGDRLVGINDILVDEDSAGRFLREAWGLRNTRFKLTVERISPVSMLARTLNFLIDGNRLKEKGSSARQLKDGTEARKTVSIDDLLSWKVHAGVPSSSSRSNM